MLDQPVVVLDWLRVFAWVGVIAMGWCAGVWIWSLLARGTKAAMAKRA